MPNPHAHALSEQLRTELHEAREYLRSLPSLKLADISEDDTCPICLNTLASIIVEESNHGDNREGSIPGRQAHTDEALACTQGVVKLETCGHVFCRMDLSEWIESLHGTCPTCRTVFFEFTQYSDADLESSDGGEYIPGNDDVDMEEDDEFEEEDELDETDYDAFPSIDIEWAERPAEERWQQMVHMLSGARSRVFRAARDVMSETGMHVDEEDSDESSENNWLEEDTGFSSSAGDMTEGSDEPTSEELSSNSGDIEKEQDDADIYEADFSVTKLEPIQERGEASYSSAHDDETEENKSVGPSN